MKSLKAEAQMLLYGILFLFMFQLMAEFLEAIYAFGLMGTSIPVELVSLLVVFSPVALCAFPRRLPGWVTPLLGTGVLASRVVEVMLDTRGRMIVSGLGVGCALAFLPALFCAGARKQPRASILGAGLTLGLGLSALLRVLGSGYDLSLHRPSQAIGWGLAAAAGILLSALRESGQMHVEKRTPEDGERAGVGRTIGLALGLTSAWVLLYLSFSAPNVIARWTGASYALVVALVTLVLCAFAFAVTSVPRLHAFLQPGRILAWNAMFVVALVWTILAHQITFPPSLDSYPLFEPAVLAVGRVPLWLLLVLFPVLLLDWTLLAQEILRSKQTPRVLGATFAVSSLFTLLVILGQVFTTVYDYVPLVGPFFRDRFWFVYLVPGIVLALSTLLVRQETPVDVSRASKARFLPAAMALISLAALAGVALTSPRPAAMPAAQTGLRVCTYNIQQGYDERGSRNYAGQLALLRRVDADVIGLQESDTNRVAGGNADIVRYFADQLNMHSYYGPKTVPGTFGVALLSKYPIENARTFYMYSAGEQTATIVAQVAVGDKVYNALVTHLGNDGPAVQQEAILRAVAGQENVILMGDFNFRPDTVQYWLTTSTLDDAWLLRWSRGVDDQGRRFDHRIDHVFVSKGIAVGNAEYMTDPDSDHPALVVEIE